ncbi:MAG: nucleotidyltransferase family protein [Planctomycetota bacterium]
MSTVGLILAAGDSSRMGEAKALLPFDGATFLGHAAATLHAGGAHEVVIVVGGRHRAAIEAHAATLPGPVVVVVNEDPAEGPISSVRVGLAARPEAELYLVQPVDVPGVERGDVAALLRAAEDRPEVDAVVPSVAMRRGHPLLLRGGTARRLLSVEGRRLRSVRELLADDAVRLHHEVLGNRALIRDIDTPEELGALRRPAAGGDLPG